MPAEEPPKKVTVLDTSVLVKPSQLPRGGLAAKKQSEYLRDQMKDRYKSAENRLKLFQPQKHTEQHKRNLADLQKAFRNKQLVHPYKHPELEKLPFERMDEEKRVTFEPSKLPAKQKEAYDKMVENAIGRAHGEPLEFADKVFEGIESRDFDVRPLREDLVYRNMVFSKKLDVMNDEFDEYIGALVAQLIFQQVVINEKKRKNAVKVDGMAVGGDGPVDYD